MALFSFPKQVNERAARLVAAAVAVSSAVAMATQTWWVVPVLAGGFLLRVGWGPRFSPLARLAVATAERLWEVRPVAGAPKRFAQGIGAAVTVTASALLAAGLTVPGWALMGVLVFFAMLEAALSFCFGCWLYGALQRAGVLRYDVCTDCATAPAKP